MISMKHMGDKLAHEQDAMLAGHDSVASVKERLSFDPATYSRRRSRVPFIAAAACVGLAAAAVVAVMIMPESISVWVGDKHEQLEIGSWISSSNNEKISLEFSDGSTIELQSDSVMRVQDLNANGARLLLERGVAGVKVAHRPGADWKIDVGPYLVFVTGTSFDISWKPENEELALDMKDGTVRLEGPMLAPGRILSAGERIRVSLTDRKVEISSVDEEAQHGLREDDAVAAATDITNELEIGPDEGGVEEETTVNEMTRGSPPRKLSWKNLAEQGKYREAVALAEEIGFDAIVARSSASDLMAFADVFRRAGNMPRAEQAYRAVRTRFPGTSHASSAAFVLGRMAFEKKKAYAQAARWFEACLQDKKAGGFTREALGRLIEALQRSGDRAKAGKTAREYLDRYPQGPHASLARTLVHEASEEDKI